MDNLTNLYEIIVGIFSKATLDIQHGFYGAGERLFDNTFFNSAFSLYVVFVGFMVLFRKFENEQIAYKVIWTLLVFTIVKSIVYRQDIYSFLLDILNFPRDIFIEMIHGFTSRINEQATIENIVKNISISVESLAQSIYAKGSLTNFTPYIYAIIIYISGLFLLVVILLNTIFSIFLSDIIMILLPFVAVFLIYTKTQYIFFNWVKLYISVSLYAPFTMLFGLLSVYTVDLTINLSNALKNDFQSNIELVFALVIAQALTTLAIFKIPNIINQLIGSSNEGSSLTNGVGTVSAGVTIMSGFSKVTGLNFASNASRFASKKIGNAVTNSESYNKWKHREIR